MFTYVRYIHKRLLSYTVVDQAISRAGSLKYHHRLSEDNTCVLPASPTFSKFIPGDHESPMNEEPNFPVAEEPDENKKKSPPLDPQSSSFPTSITFVVVEEPDMSEEKLPSPPQSPSSSQGNN